MQDFLPNDGTLFDDQRGPKPPTVEELNSLAFRQELNQRPGVTIFVHNQEERREMRKVCKYWMMRNQLHHMPSVMVDSSLKPGTTNVRYPS